MWGLVKASQLLQLVKQYDTEVLNASIELKMGNCFSATCGDIDNDFINIVTIAKHSSLKDNREYFDRYFELENKYTMFQNFYEVFSLLHEIGHIITSVSYDRKKEMQEFKAKEYRLKYDKYAAYRQLESEKAADEYAINFIKEHILELYMLMNNMDEKTAKTEFTFWASL